MKNNINNLMTEIKTYIIEDIMSMNLHIILGISIDNIRQKLDEYIKYVTNEDEDEDEDEDDAAQWLKDLKKKTASVFKKIIDIDVKE